MGDGTIQVAEATRVPLPQAEALAGELVELLKPWCERIEVAGSIRRRRTTVKDVEIVCIPSVEVERDLFGEGIGQCNLLHSRVSALVEHGTLALRRDKYGRGRFGERYKALRYRGAEGEIGVDLFAVLPPAQFGLIYAIRTGPAAFSHRLVTPRDRTVAIGDGQFATGLLPFGYRVKDGAFWHFGQLVETPEETDVFLVLGLDWIPPEER